MQIGPHSNRRFVGDFDGRLQDSLRYNVVRRVGSGLSTQVQPIRKNIKKDNT